MMGGKEGEPPPSSQMKKPRRAVKGEVEVTKEDVKALEKEVKKATRARMKKYRREGDKTRYVTEPDQPGRLTRALRKAKSTREAAIKSAAQAELVHHVEEAGYLEAGEGERTKEYTQKEIKQHLDVQTKRKRFDIRLDKLGPYVHSYSPNGNMVALGGAAGHMAVFEWKKFKLFGEVQLKDRLRDIQFLHDDQLLATAQKKYTYIYNNQGTEIHILKNLQNICKLDFLPYHMLLTAVGQHGVLHYFDVSTGTQVAAQKTKLGPCNVMRQNRWNAVMGLGHSHGVVTMWSPTSAVPLVKILAHKGPLTDITYSLDGKYMITAAEDTSLKVWDTRTWRTLHTVHQRSHPTSIDISQTGLLSVASSYWVEVWKGWEQGKPAEPYLFHKQPTSDIVQR
eukprot:Sspe_Gene.87908::Locus_59933_Transcript_1_1_Confidence_1.000_Length_1217::g.87908::m.87908/K14768/UTP7, WDR46; U3 small nucleolar RNA-associated protein 7